MEKNIQPEIVEISFIDGSMSKKGPLLRSKLALAWAREREQETGQHPESEIPDTVTLNILFKFII